MVESRNIAGGNALLVFARNNIKPLLGVIVVLLFVSVAAIYIKHTTCSQREVERASAVSDPATLSLKRGFNDYVQCVHLADGTEVGIIHCQDGSSACYWFRSHHLSSDEGCTLFRLSDGRKVYMKGYFCCEVQLPEIQLSSLTDLVAFIQKNGE